MQKEGRATTVLVMIGLLSLGLNLFHNGFSSGFHPDEQKKVRAVKKGVQDFRHPILMLQVNRAAKAVLGYEDRDSILRMGRTVSALAGVVITVATYFLARQMMSTPFALLAALAACCSPILVIHAHYFKEDMIFSAALMLSLLAYLRLIKEGDLASTALAGVLTGFAVSAHYKGFLLLPFYLMMPFAVRKLLKLDYFKKIALVTLTAVCVFAATNYPLFGSWSTAMKGIGASAGQSFGVSSAISISPWDHWLAYHYLHSLVPGMTVAVALFSLAAVLWSALRFPSLETAARVTVLCLMMYYLAIEISPFKPYPGFVRYAVPVVPLLLVICCRQIEKMYRSEWLPAPRLFVSLVAALLVLAPAYSSARLVGNLVDDTRMRAVKIVQATGKRALFDKSVRRSSRFKSLAGIDPEKVREEGVRFLVVGSSRYERDLYAAGLEGQHPNVYRRAAAYRRLFQYPYEEVSPAYKSFGFSNPPIRIIDIGERDGLEQTVP